MNTRFRFPSPTSPNGPVVRRSPQLLGDGPDLPEIDRQRTFREGFISGGCGKNHGCLHAGWGYGTRLPANTARTSLAAQAVAPSTHDPLMARPNSPELPAMTRETDWLSGFGPLLHSQHRNDSQPQERRRASDPVPGSVVRTANRSAASRLRAGTRTRGVLAPDRTVLREGRLRPIHFTVVTVLQSSSSAPPFRGTQAGGRPAHHRAGNARIRIKDRARAWHGLRISRQ